MRGTMLSAIALAGIILFAGQAMAVERHVPSEYSTIQAAINACNTGDVVIIAPGTYTGAGNKNLDFAGRAITVRSTNPSDPCIVAATIIDCESSGRGFYFHTNEDANSVVDGLTITHGYAANGGGIVCLNASPTIRNCIITGNQSQNGANAQYGGDGYHGGGVYCDTSSARFENCTISYNYAGRGGNGYSEYHGPPQADPGRGGAGGHGGGLYLLNSSLTIIDCDIVYNHAGRGGDYEDPWQVGGRAGNGGSGGGIIGSASSATITDCNITHNGAGSGGNGYPFEEFNYGYGGWGGGLYWSGSGLEVSDSVIRSNGAGAAGAGDPGSGYGSCGGIGCMGGSFTIKNCEITENCSATRGSGVYCSGSTVVISNCTISANGPGFMGYGSGICQASGSITVTNSIIWGNEAGLPPEEISGSPEITYSDVRGGWTGAGNIDANPFFAAGPLGNYYLSQIAAGQVTNSPCVDAGSDTAANLGMTFKTTRTDGFIDTGIVDMGYHYPLNPGDPDLNRDTIVNFNDYAIFAEDWQLPPDPNDPNSGDIVKDGQVNMYDLAQLVEDWLTCFVTEAINPVPSDTATGISINVILRWTAGENAVSHDVFFGTNFNEVNNADIDNPTVYMGNQDANFWDTNNCEPAGPDFNTTYYWRIDEEGSVCKAKGNVWTFTTNPEPNIDIGLVSHWKFDEGTGTVAYDSKGDNDGNLINGPVWTSGQINGALSFDGVNDYVDVPNNASLRFTQYDKFSFAIWVNPTTANVAGTLICKMRTGGQSNIFGYYAQWNIADQKFYFVTERSQQAYVAISTPSAPPGSWYHVVCVYDNTNMKIYLDGQLKNTGTFTGGTGTSSPAKNLAICARSYDSTMDYFFGGTLDDVRIYNRALTAEEIALLYQQGQ